MSFQGYQGEVNHQVGHENSGADVEAQLMQLSQVQLARILSSAVSQVLTQQIQPIVKPVQTPLKFDIPAFEGDSAVSDSHLLPLF